MGDGTGHGNYIVKKKDVSYQGFAGTSARSRIESHVSAALDLFTELCAIPVRLGTSVRSPIASPSSCALWASRSRRTTPGRGSTPTRESPVPGCRRRMDGGTPIFLCAHLDTVPPQGRARAGRLRTASSATRAGTILGADNKSAVVAMLEAARRIVAERRPHARRRAAVHSKEEVGLLGAGAFDIRQLEAELGFVYDQAAPIGEVDHGRAATARRCSSASTAGPHTRAWSRRRAAPRSPPLRAPSRTSGSDGSTTRRPRTSGMITGGSARSIVPEWCELEAEARSHDARKLADLVQEMLDTFALRGERRRSARSRPRSARPTRATASSDERSDRPARGRPRSSAAATSSCPTLTGGGADANVFNTQRACPA